MKPHYFFASVTRCSDLWIEPFETRRLDRAHWATGDFVVGRITGERNRLYRCETKTGRMTDMVRGDLIVGALGRRAATLEGVGDWRAVDENLELEALTSAGLLGKSTSISPMFPNLMHMHYEGHVVRGSRKINMKDFVIPAAPKKLNVPVILLIGTSMSSGKTASGRLIIRALKYMGINVAAAKLTGSARYRDILQFRDAGASFVIDFVDAGLPSTVCEEANYRAAFDLMIAKIAASDAQVLVAESGASPLEPYNGATVVKELADKTCFTVLCASDPHAVLGVQTAFGPDLKASIVSGPAANTSAAADLVRQLCNLDALNLLDRGNYPELSRRLLQALGLQETDIANEARSYMNERSRG
ncbi:MAG: hypothetical protein V2I48_00580 [Xanthomonadales bacterium]|jgi:hypothetical protein|nr:hypothetical protein [Xanthomonadales bacterium]